MCCSLAASQTPSQSCVTNRRVTTTVRHHVLLEWWCWTRTIVSSAQTVDLSATFFLLLHEDSLSVTIETRGSLVGRRHARERRPNQVDRPFDRGRHRPAIEEPIVRELYLAPRELLADTLTHMRNCQTSWLFCKAPVMKM